MKIGTECWLYNNYRRAFNDEDRDDPMFGWERFEVIGETRMSWIVGPDPTAPEYRQWKIKKRDLSTATMRTRDSRPVSWSRSEIEMTHWLGRHRHRVAEMLRHAAPETVAEIARWLRYDPAPPTHQEDNQ